jgi:hypothetical protein
MLKEPYIYRSADKFIPYYEDFRHSDIEQALSIIDVGGDDLPSATCQAFWHYLGEAPLPAAVSFISAESVLHQATGYDDWILTQIASVERRLGELQSSSMHDQRLSSSAACVFVHLSGLTARWIGFSSEGMSERVIEILERAIKVFDSAHQGELTLLNKTESALRVSALLAKSWMHAVLFDHNANSLRYEEALEQLALAVDACIKAGRVSGDIESDPFISNSLPRDEVNEVGASTFETGVTQEGTINLQESFNPNFAFRCFELLYLTGKGIDWNSVAHNGNLIRDAYRITLPVPFISTVLLSPDLAFDDGFSFGIEPGEAWGHAIQMAHERGAGGPIADQIEGEASTALRDAKARLELYFFESEAAISERAWGELVEADTLYLRRFSAGPVIATLNHAIRLLLKENIKTVYNDWLHQKSAPVNGLASLVSLRPLVKIDDIGDFFAWVADTPSFQEFVQSKMGGDGHRDWIALKETLKKFNTNNNDQRHDYKVVDLREIYREVMGSGCKGLIQMILDFGARLKA